MTEDFDFGAFADAIEETVATTPHAGGDPALPGGTALRYFGDYLLEAEIARGGMGIVYRARQLSLDRSVAVKVLRDGAFAGGQEVERFKREASSAASLRHRNIVGIHEIGEHEGTHFFSMDYVAGQTLGQMLRDGPLPPARAAALMVKIAQAIHHAHAAGVLHRDIKPSNVIIDAEGEPMVMDFGLAKRDAAEMGLTLSGQVLGTPAYMAPEQAEGLSRQAAAPTDVYGLGALLYHMLTGRAPFTGDSHMAVLTQVVNDDPVSAVLLNPSVPRDLETVCAKAMAKEPARRYFSAQAMADDLQRFLDGRPVLARPVSSLGRLWRWSHRHRALAASLAGVALLLAGITIVSTVSAQRLRISRDAERSARDQADASAWRAEMNLYAADMKTAAENWEEGAMGAMMQRLADHVPAAGGRDPRGFEWHLLNRLSQGDQTDLFHLPAGAKEAVFTPDARWLLVNGEGRSRLCDAERLTEVLAWDEPTSQFQISYRRLVALADGTLIGTASTGLRLLDPKGGTQRLLDATPCESMALSRDGARLAVATRYSTRDDKVQNSVRIYRTDTWQVEKELRYLCRGLAWTAKGELVVLDLPGTAPARLTWLDLNLEAPVRQFDFNPGNSFVQIALLTTETDRAYLQLGNLEDVFCILSTGTVLQRRGGATMEQVAVNPDFSSIVQAGQDQALRVLNLLSWKESAARRGHTARVLAVAFTADGKSLRSVAMDGTLRHWHIVADNQAALYRIGFADWKTWQPVTSAGDGRFTAFLTEWDYMNNRDTSIIWDRRERKAVATPDAVALAFTPDGASVLALRKNKILLIRLTEKREHVLTELPSAPKHWLPRVSADWRWLAWTETGTDILITELQSGREAGRIPVKMGVPAFSPDGRRLAVPAGNLLLFDPAAGTTDDTGISSSTLVAWSPDSQHVAVRTETLVEVFSLSGKNRTHSLTGHRAQVCSMAWSPDGRTLAVGCEDSTLHFWNLATGRDTAVLTLHCAPNFLTFTPDGSAIITGGMGGYRVLEAAPLVIPGAPSAAAFPFPAADSGTPMAEQKPPAATESEESVVKRRLVAIRQACRVYKDKHGRWPDHLSTIADDLPEPRHKALMSPEAERTGHFIWRNDFADPAFPSPFQYCWCNVALDGPPAGMEWTGERPVTQRDYHEWMRARYGDKVPFILVFGKHEEGKLPAILYDGTVAYLPSEYPEAFAKGWRPVPWK